MNRDYLLSAMGSLSFAYEALGKYMDSGATGKELVDAREQITRLHLKLHLRPELDEFREHLRDSIGV